ncbi:MAG: hypothetical protein JO224_07105 [Pelomonas sp.]|nr:hypothetical protein [Roseateles sp.]
MQASRLLTLALLTAALTGCALGPRPAARSETTLPLNRAWYDGQEVEYVTTDISNRAMAETLGVNYAPRLADALPGPGHVSIVERVYKFPGGEQRSVFQSAPVPGGAANRDDSYSPLWRLVLVRWTQAPHELRDEEAILAAAERGELRLEITDIVVNCPVTRSPDGAFLKGVR